MRSYHSVLNALQNNIHAKITGRRGRNALARDVGFGSLTLDPFTPLELLH